MKLIIPSTIMKILLNFSCALTQPTFENIIVLFAGAVLTNGARTITNMLRAVRPLATKSFSSYHRVLSRSELCLFALARILATLLFRMIPGRIELVVDETISRHKGKMVYGISCHRDKVRSSRKNIAYTYGHYWVVLCVNVHMPFLPRPWSLPIMALLWMSKKNCARYNLKHRTPIELTIIMLKKVSRWFPERTFSLTGDGGFASYELISFCSKHHRFELISRLRLDAKLYALPPKKKPKGRHRGRPPQKGKRIRSPKEEVAHKNKNKRKWKTATVTWYGNTPKNVEYFAHQALVYQPGKGTTLIAYTIVFDPKDNSFETLFTTDLSLSAEETIRLFIERWAIEVTFEEARKFLHIESARNRTKDSVIRSFPLLLSIFSIISLWYFQTFKEQNHSISHEQWYTKTEPTFADAIAAIRHELWRTSIFSMSTQTDDMIKIDLPFINFITESLARAA